MNTTMGTARINNARATPRTIGPDNTTATAVPPRRRVAVAGAIATALLLAGCGGADQPATDLEFESTPIVALNTPPPSYPIELACQDIGGQVVLDVTIGTDGRPTQIRLNRSSGVEQLDAIAQEAVRDWQFRAATANGQPVERTIEVPMTFNPPDVRPQQCFVLDEQQ